MTKALNKLKKIRDEAQEALELGWLAEIDKVARKHRLTKIVFGWYGTNIYRGEKQVECKPIRDLEEWYNNNVDRQGFDQDDWNSETGWRKS